MEERDSHDCRKWKKFVRLKQRLLTTSGNDITMRLDKGHVYPESTKNGFVSLIAEAENAELAIVPTKVSARRKITSAFTGCSTFVSCYLNQLY